METRGLRLLYFGQATWGSTSLQRYFALQNFFGESYIVDSRRVFPDKKSGRTFFKSVQARLGVGSLLTISSKILLQEVERFKPDIVWVDGGFLLPKDIICFIQKNFKCQFIHYTPDSLSAPGKSNRCMKNAISAYDVVVTTKEQDLKLYEKFSAKRVIFSLQGFDPNIHKPITLSSDEKLKFDSDVSFVGHYMKDRATALDYILNQLNIKISIYGTGWNNHNVSNKIKSVFYGEAVADDYAKVIAGTKIILGFLNNDVQDTFTTRTFEIPACKGFLLAERSKMHEKLLTEGLEAEFFSDNNEMLYKINQYLTDDSKRKEIAFNGHRRVIDSGYSWSALMEKIIAEI